MNKKVILQNDSPMLDVHEDLPLSSVLLHANTVIEIDNQIDNQIEVFRNDRDDITQSLFQISPGHNQASDSFENNMITDFCVKDARKTESLPEIQRHRGKGAEIDIQLSKVVSNIVGYFTVTLFDKIKDHVMSCPIKDVDPTWDYFNLRASLNMLNLCSKELVMKNLGGNKHQ